MEKVLPKGWILSNIEDSIDILDNMRKPVSSDERAKRLGTIPYYGATGLAGYIDDYLFEEELILVGEDGAPFFDKLKNVAFKINGKSWVNNHAHVLRARSVTNNDFLLHYLNQFNYNGFVGGTTRLKLTQGDLKKIPFPLPPLAEQERIVVKLDKLFGQHEKIKAALARIPQLLKIFRQQVLTHAVTGKLTEQWREGKNLEEWKEVDLQEVSKIVDPHPSHRTPPEVENGIPYISIGDINLDKSINFKKSRKVSEKILEEHIARYTIKKGDFIFGKIGTLGKPIKIPAKQNYCLSANVILIQPNENLVISEYVYIYLDSPYLLKKVLEKSVATSQAAYGIKKMRVEKINLPSRIEQQEIVSRVESLFAKADAIEARYTNLKKKIDSLPQAILHKAFKGELVPQLPTDGDAKDLLAAIIKLKEEAKGKRGKR